MESPHRFSESSHASRFPATHWSLVAAAGGAAAEPDARAALEALCERYWYPLYGFARRSGCAPDAAADLTQDCFLRILSGDTLSRADPDKGRFRSFLLGIMKHVLADENRRRTARCRDAGRTFSLDADTAESRFAMEPESGGGPDNHFDRAWAQALVGRALGRLEQEWARGEEERRRFAVLRPFLLQGREGGHLLATAGRLGLSESAARSLIHRLRQRFAGHLRAEVAMTVHDPADTDDELRCLLRAIAA